jgi:hypothetical protein
MSRIQLYDGVSVRMPYNFRLRCCDCALVHAVRIVPKKNGLRLMVVRDKARTTKSRKLKRYSHVKSVKWPQR